MGKQTPKCPAAEKVILVVDDSITIRQQLRAFLEPHAFRVLEAGDGAEGLSRAQGERVDMLIVDVNMPGMDGLEMLGEIRKLEGYARTPAFVLTTESSPDLVRRGKGVGATAWIVKPFNPDTLFKGLRKVLGL
jgi:two-component system chemotaxis response regulator CheY